jgi:hypothetical protein
MLGGPLPASPRTLMTGDLRQYLREQARLLRSPIGKCRLNLQLGTANRNPSAQTHRQNPNLASSVLCLRLLLPFGAM